MPGAPSALKSAFEAVGVGYVATTSFATVAALADVPGPSRDAVWAAIEPSATIVDESGPALAV